MIEVHSNGNGHTPRALGDLLDMLAAHPLDATFENYGNFCYEPRSCIYGGTDPDTGKAIYHDTGLIHPDKPNVVRFWGNFFTWSHVFEIDTDDAEVIEVLHAAIEANRRRPDYLAQIASATPKAVRA